MYFYSQRVMWMSVMFSKNIWAVCVVYFKLSPSPSSSSVCPLWAESGFSAGQLQPCRWLAESRLRTETKENVFRTCATDEVMLSRGRRFSGRICTSKFWEYRNQNHSLSPEIIGSGVNCHNCQLYLVPGFRTALSLISNFGFYPRLSKYTRTKTRKY